MITGELTRGEKPKVLHLVGLPPDVVDSGDQREQLPWPTVLVLEKEPDGYSLYRYTESGDFGGDTWHMTLDDAKHQAEFEFGQHLDCWRDVPEEVTDPIAYALQGREEEGHS